MYMNIEISKPEAEAIILREVCKRLNLPEHEWLCGIWENAHDGITIQVFAQTEEDGE